MMGSASESEKTDYEIHSDWKAAQAKNAAARGVGSLRKLWQTPQTRRINRHKSEKDEFMASASTTIGKAFTMMSSDDDGEGEVKDHACASKPKSVARRSPRSQAEPPMSIKRITRSTSSPIGKGSGGKSGKRRSSSLRRIYFASPRSVRIKQVDLLLI